MPMDTKFTGKCNYCHRTGHKMADCRKKAADAKSKGGTHAISAEQGGSSTRTGSVAAIEQGDESDQNEFFCMVLSTDCEHEVTAISGGTFLTLDTASDCHWAPTEFGDGCKQRADSSPMVWDAQKVIEFDSVATVPMTTMGPHATLLKAAFRLGSSVSKPILSFLEVVDNGAEVWLSKNEMKMYVNKD